MGRAAFAFRDLDEELQAFADDDYVHVYQNHSSPPQRSEVVKPLTESMVLKQYVEHQRNQRRRKLLGGVLFVVVALLGILPMLLFHSEGEEVDNALELALSAPYKALRTKGESKQQYSAPVDDDDMRIDRLDHPEPNVGDTDPHDVIQTEETDGEQGEEGEELASTEDADMIHEGDRDDDDAPIPNHEEPRGLPETTADAANPQLRRTEALDGEDTYP